MLLEEGAAVVIEDRWEAVAMRGRGQAVVQSQWNWGQFVLELILLLRVTESIQYIQLVNFKQTLNCCIAESSVRYTMICATYYLFLCVCIVCSLSGKWYSLGMHVVGCDPMLGAQCAEAAGCPGRGLS